MRGRRTGACARPGHDQKSVSRPTDKTTRPPIDEFNPLDDL
jgi:hypothetical protein